MNKQGRVCSESEHNRYLGRRRGKLQDSRLPSPQRMRLVRMEGRLGTKIDSTNAKVDRALETLEELEVRVGATEANIDRRIEEAEERIQVRVAGQVKTMVLDQLQDAFFDP